MSQASDLLRLQDIDLALIRCRAAAKDLPQRPRVSAARAAARKVSGELTKIVGKRKDLEIELADLEESRSAYAAKVNEAQSRLNGSEGGYRDVAGIEAMLSNLAKRLEKVEFETERLMGELELTERAERNATELKGRLEAQRADLEASLAAQAEGLAAKAKGLLEERADVASRIDASLMGGYERASKRYAGVAVETLSGNRPSACRVALQPSSFSDIRRGPAITTCPYCKRILIVSDEGDE